MVRDGPDGDEIPVIANITGTLYAPKVTLESTFRPPISETDLVSYLITGYPANEAAQVGQGTPCRRGSPTSRARSPASWSAP